MDLRPPCGQPVHHPVQLIGVALRQILSFTRILIEVRKVSAALRYHEFPGPLSHGGLVAVLPEDGAGRQGLTAEQDAREIHAVDLAVHRDGHTCEVEDRRHHIDADRRG